MTTCYISHIEMQRSTSGVEIASLIGNSLRLSSGVIAGAASLAVTPVTTVALNANDQITIFDGAQSEQLVVASTTAIGASSVPLLTPTAFAHATLTPACTDGLFGSLADQICDASDWLENICQQSLFQATQTETVRIPSMRAAIDNQQQLVIRPRNFPVTAITSLGIKNNNSYSSPYDPTQTIIESNGQSVSIPWLTSTTGNSTYSLTTNISRRVNSWVTYSYTHGYTLANMPGSIHNAAVLLTCDILAHRENPSGVDQLQLGKRNIVTSPRSDNTGQSMLLKSAMRQLQSYILEAY